ncbi:MAG: hypothetical protein ACUVUR_01065 [bacterium]
MKRFFVICCSLSLALAMNLPEPGVRPQNAVDFATAQTLALKKAQAEWQGCRLGTVVPYVDEAGQTVAYMFHLRTDGKEFPDYEQVVEDILAERTELSVNTDLTIWRSKYAHILISARYDRTPIVCYGYGTSPFYAVAPEGLRRAREILGPDAYLSRIYFICPVSFLEFSNRQGERIIFSLHFEQHWSSRDDFTRYLSQQKAKAGMGNTDPLAIAHYQKEWDEALAADFLRFDEVYVPDVNRAPFYDWSYGCTPTSAAMVMGYIDRTQDYGRLVDWFWQRWDMVEGEWDKQIPNVQRECALNMFTDTTRGATTIGAIGQGLYLVAYENGYPNFEVIEDLGTSGNDWAWSTIVQEIDRGYAMVWSALWQVHSLAAYGYRTPQKDIYVHNTWWTPAEWWHYSGPERSHVASPHPAGGDPHKIEVRYPMGDTFYNSIGRGEVLQVGDTVEVRWDNFGNPAHAVAIDISTNAGRNWSLLDSVPDNGSYRWFINPSLSACDSVRLRFRQYHNGVLVSADGTFGCFRLLREPVPPLSLAPPNGQQIFSPPIVLLVDTTRTDIDSFCFRVVYGTGDTIWSQAGTAPSCSLPDTLFTYGRSYKWVCKGHNRFGWGEFGTPWSFWVRFRPGVEEKNHLAEAKPEIKGSTVRVVGQDAVEFQARVGVEIYNAAGKLVRTLKSQDSQRLLWDLRDGDGKPLPAGMYFVRLLGGAAASSVQKLIIMN